VNHHREIDRDPFADEIPEQQSDQHNGKSLLEAVNSMGQGYDDIHQLQELVDNFKRYNEDVNRASFYDKVLGEEETAGHTVLARPRDLVEVFGSQSEFNFYRFCQDARLSHFMSNRLLRMVTAVSLDLCSCRKPTWLYTNCVLSVYCADQLEHSIQTPIN
jgi:hypothetical protein